jgi:hypothetical protein
MRVSPGAFAHVEAECTPVARMSEATSGIPFRLDPHVAPLMRATVWVGDGVQSLLLETNHLRQTQQAGTRLGTGVRPSTPSLHRQPRSFLA